MVEFYAQLMYHWETYFFQILNLFVSDIFFYIKVIITQLSHLIIFVFL